ncbi:amino acid--[acyl-carrier-protein] ligase [Cupriavidus necator]|uniref:Amino acid--[acyl-carrier-protein] ligase n=1 Tax=Cupriavidus necator TaxID=106590 RepID=A0A1U9UU58_CUPNE|nr:amino acid--[acyl-carrier-protein] ligase [Cupriavidus necator]AQV96190.1 amino acid--[acyl-carrier-protein] ligase [Cupriavidus necator]
MDAHTLTDAGAMGGAVADAHAPAPGIQPASSTPTFLERLLAEGLMIETGVRGIYGRSATFESICDGVNAAMTRLGHDQDAELLRFPPAMGQADFENSGYLNSFPQLAGTIHSFCGDDKGHRRLLARLESNEDWTDQQQPTGVVLTPAACYPIYPVIARRGPLPEGGKVVDVLSYCFRHEPSLEPTRMQLFRQREYVCLGTPERITAFREQWLARGLQLGERLQLPVEIDVANDPFFGRGGKLVAESQRELKLKFELLIPVNDGAGPTACMSFNYHMDHFGTTWGLRTADGGIAHTGCVGIGVERMTLALLRYHGLDPARWPQAVRDTLWGG